VAINRLAMGWDLSVFMIGLIHRWHKYFLNRLFNLDEFFVLCYQAWLALLGVVCVGLAIGVSFGLASAFGVFYGPVHSTLPFLLLGKIT